MQVNNIVTFQGVYVDVQQATGNTHKYVRLAPDNWIWLSSAYAMVDPGLLIWQLEDAYAAAL